VRRLGKAARARMPERDIVRPGHLHDLLGFQIIWLEIIIADGPILTDAVDGFHLEIVWRQARRLRPPAIRAATEAKRIDPRLLVLLAQIRRFVRDRAVFLVGCLPSVIAVFAPFQHQDPGARKPIHKAFQEEDGAKAGAADHQIVFLLRGARIYERHVAKSSPLDIDLRPGRARPGPHLSRVLASSARRAVSIAAAKLVAPNLPRRFACFPQSVKHRLVAQRIHGLPKAKVPVGAELAPLHELS
jgi:hypothetical protein